MALCKRQVFSERFVSLDGRLRHLALISHHTQDRRPTGLRRSAEIRAFETHVNNRGYGAPKLYPIQTIPCRTLSLPNWDVKPWT